MNSAKPLLFIIFFSLIAKGAPGLAGSWYNQRMKVWYSSWLREREREFVLLRRVHVVDLLGQDIVYSAQIKRAQGRLKNLESRYSQTRICVEKSSQLSIYDKQNICKSIDYNLERIEVCLQLLIGLARNKK